MRRAVSPDLPAPLRAALDARLQGISLSSAAERAAAISRTYRDGGGSSAIANEIDALAYAMARMPATYAADVACLNALIEARPDFTPGSLLDVGAGPGTATWAAAEAFTSLQSFTLLDANDEMQKLALGLFDKSGREINYGLGAAHALLTKAEPADLVVASYVIGEMREAYRISLAAEMWEKTRDTLLVVEPGTPAGYARIIALREQLVARGGYVAAPCPHEHACPLIPPDWCHFVQRLARSRSHKQVKGAEAPFEDEKFAYVALTRGPPAHRSSRVLAQPIVGKAAVAARLCTPHGLETARVPRRDREGYARARRWRWGDAVSLN